ncbi:MAG TPA: alpha/beta fold hydrolase [Drouetiella sp.]
MTNYPNFEPLSLLRNGHMMTIVPALWARQLPPITTPSVDRLFQVKPHIRILAKCHFAPDAKTRSTLIVIHGLEGSSDTQYVLGLTHKALEHGMNVVRLNLRNCGNTLHLTPTLYNAGLSADLIAVATELMEVDGLKSIFAAGYSLGGNIVLKAASELGKSGSELFKAVCAVSPALDLATCVDALEQGFNRFYEQRFLIGLKDKIRIKHKLFPSLYDLSKLKLVRTLRGFDDVFTAPDAGYSDSSAYYEGASAVRIIDQAEIPVLIIAAKDDPIVPFKSFDSPKLKTKYITMLTPEHGGHSGFVNATYETKGKIRDRFWAENRIIEFCLSHSDSL